MQKTIFTIIFILIFQNAFIFAQKYTTDFIEEQLSDTELKLENEAEDQIEIFNQNFEIQLRQEQKLNLAIKEAESIWRKRKRRKELAKVTPLKTNLNKQILANSKVAQNAYTAIFQVYHEKLALWNITDPELSAKYHELLQSSKKLLDQTNAGIIKINTSFRSNTAQEVSAFIEQYDQIINYQIEAFEIYKEQLEKNKANEFDEWQDTSENEFEYNQVDTSLVTFWVQIFALKRQLSEKEVNTIETNKKLDVLEHEEGSFFKYSVGPFLTYDTARNFADTIGKNSFVVGFQDKIRIQNIDEAINLSKKQIKSRINNSGGGF